MKRSNLFVGGSTRRHRQTRSCRIGDLRRQRRKTRLTKDHETSKIFLDKISQRKLEIVHQ